MKNTERKENFSRVTYLRTKNNWYVKEVHVSKNLTYKIKEEIIKKAQLMAKKLNKDKVIIH